MYLFRNQVGIKNARKTPSGISPKNFTCKQGEDFRHAAKGKTLYSQFVSLIATRMYSTDARYVQSAVQKVLIQQFLNHVRSVEFVAKFSIIIPRTNATDDSNTRGAMLLLGNSLCFFHQKCPVALEKEQGSNM